MALQELQSAKYLDSQQDCESRPIRSGRVKRRVSTTGDIVFRVVLFLGIAATVYWFYKNQDPILANIRDNSGQYGDFFSDLVKDVQPGVTSEFVKDEPEDVVSNPHSFSPHVPQSDLPN